MQNNTGIIIRREFTERVAKKSFIITTLLMPVIMLLLMLAPTLIALISTPTDRTIAVVDQSGIIMPALQNADIEHITFEQTDLPFDSVIANMKYDGVLTINADIVDNPRTPILYLHNAGSIEIEGRISHIIKQEVEQQRLQAYDINDLQKILDEIEADVNLQTIRINENGDGESTSSMLSFGLGLFMTFLLYMFLLMYGSMVMTSIIEEKGNRVLELVVSSVKPIQLMLGKILGIGLVAVTQVVIWGVLLCLMSALLLPAIIPADISNQVAMFNAGNLDATTATADIDMIQALSFLGSVGGIAKLFGYILLFLIGGFLFYASIFAAIGSAVDNIQDASQLQSFAIIPIIIALVFGITIASDPNSTMAVWMSMIPFTSPMVMLTRIPFGIDPWQIIVSIVILYASFILMAWISAKIYRVGIFMYGKKPSVRDLIRWARYK